jgi:RNAse (barnase) inhibitor barstar
VDLSDERTRSAIEEAGKLGIVVEVDGTAARTLESFFNVLSEALNLPDYFGRNWEALKDCLEDLEWLPGDSYLFIFRNADQLFSDEPIEREAFLRILNLVAQEWATPIVLGEWWDRPAIPFHVLLDDKSFKWPGEIVVIN